MEWEARVSFDQKRVGHNVLGRLPGVDPGLRQEVVIVGAHYDGGGVDPDGTVYPGAEDNASGTATLLALADALKGFQPKRTILFAAWGAEEQGAWGSRAFVESNPSLDRIAATITLDNVGVGDGRFRVYGARNFPDEYRPIAESMDAALATSFTPRGAGGSDGYTFQVRGRALLLPARGSAPTIRPYAIGPARHDGTGVVREPGSLSARRPDRRRQRSRAVHPAGSSGTLTLRVMP